MKDKKKKRPTVLIVGALKLSAAPLVETLVDLIREAGFIVNEIPHFNNLKLHLQGGQPPEIVIFFLLLIWTAVRLRITLVLYQSKAESWLW